MDSIALIMVGLALLAEILYSSIFNNLYIATEIPFLREIKNLDYGKVYFSQIKYVTVALIY